MRLIPNWKKGWKFASNWFQSAAVAFFTFLLVFPDALLKAWLLLPTDIKDHFSPHWIQGIGIFLIVGGIIARHIKQDNLDDTVGTESKPRVPGPNRLGFRNFRNPRRVSDGDHGIRDGGDIQPKD